LLIINKNQEAIDGDFGIFVAEISDRFYPSSQKLEYLELLRKYFS
jgi:hypothetical protein